MAYLPRQARDPTRGVDVHGVVHVVFRGKGAYPRFYCGLSFGFSRAETSTAPTCLWCVARRPPR